MQECLAHFQDLPRLAISQVAIAADAGGFAAADAARAGQLVKDACAS